LVGPFVGRPLPRDSGQRPRELTDPSVFNVRNEKPVGRSPTGSLVETAMLKHLKLLPNIVVKIGVKVKISVIRK